ncbi:MAG TPA: hypothetical protein VFA74_07835 [Terriglobales bacterium]|nr:hypothetical protein [Terriglobales bacterium]
MKNRRVVLGYDLRINPAIQISNPAQTENCLIPALCNSISADPNVWVGPREVETLMQNGDTGISNPLHLAKELDSLIHVRHSLHTSITDLVNVCITSSEANLIALVERYGQGWFEARVKEEELPSQGWTFKGLDVVDLDGMISGLKGCKYVDGSRTKLGTYFGSYLNDVGLFNDALIASQFAEVRGLEIPAHSPFVVVGLLIKDREI